MVKLELVEHFIGMKTIFSTHDGAANMTLECFLMLKIESSQTISIVSSITQLCRDFSISLDQMNAPRKWKVPSEWNAWYTLVGGGCKIYDNHKLMKSEKMMMILALVVLQIEICIISAADSTTHNESAVCKEGAQK